jgi:hypothetical protein
MNNMTLIADEAVKEIVIHSGNVDWIARWIAIIGLILGVSRWLFDMYKYWQSGRQVLETTLFASSAPRRLILTAVNNGRRPVYVKYARLYYTLGDQELYLTMQKENEPDQNRALLPHGDSENFIWSVNSDEIMQFRLAFSEKPELFHIKLYSAGKEIQRIPNKHIKDLVNSIIEGSESEMP